MHVTLVLPEPKSDCCNADRQNNLTIAAMTESRAWVVELDLAGSGFVLKTATQQKDRPTFGRLHAVLSRRKFSSPATMPLISLILLSGHVTS